MVALSKINGSDIAYRQLVSVCSDLAEWYLAGQEDKQQNKQRNNAECNKGDVLSNATSLHHSQRAAYGKSAFANGVDDSVDNSLVEFSVPT